MQHKSCFGALHYFFNERPWLEFLWNESKKCGCFRDEASAAHSHINEAQNMYFIEEKGGPIKIKFTDGFNPTKTWVHSWIGYIGLGICWQRWAWRCQQVPRAKHLLTMCVFQESVLCCVVLCCAVLCCVIVVYKQTRQVTSCHPDCGSKDVLRGLTNVSSFVWKTIRK